MSVRYDYPTGCTSGPAPGTTALWRVIQQRWPGARSAGIYNCRNVRGSSAKSLHAEGRAVDVRQSSKAEGDAIAAWARSSSRRYGIQEVIWNRRIWTSAKDSAGWRSYGGSNPHTDHLHIGQNRAGAQGSIGADAAIGLTGLLVLGAIGYGAFALATTRTRR